MVWKKSYTITEGYAYKDHYYGHFNEKQTIKFFPKWFAENNVNNVLYKLNVLEEYNNQWATQSGKKVHAMYLPSSY